MTYTNGTNAHDSGGLSFDKLVEALKKLDEFLIPLYYAKSEHVPLGELYVLEKSDEHPRVIIFNPGDEAKIRRTFAGYKLMRYGGYKPTDAEKEAMLNNLGKMVAKHLDRLATDAILGNGGFGSTGR